MYWLLNKTDNTPHIAGSVIAVKMITGIPKDTLYDNFGRRKQTEYNRDNWRIVKCQVERYNEMKETVSFIERSTLTEAGQVIAAIQNYNGGGHTNETFKRIMNA